MIIFDDFNKNDIQQHLWKQLLRSQKNPSGSRQLHNTRSSENSTLYQIVIISPEILDRKVIFLSTHENPLYFPPFIDSFLQLRRQVTEKPSCRQTTIDKRNSQTETLSDSSHDSDVCKKFSSKLISIDASFHLRLFFPLLLCCSHITQMINHFRNKFSGPETVSPDSTQVSGNGSVQTSKMFFSM